MAPVASQNGGPTTAASRVPASTLSAKEAIELLGAPLTLPSGKTAPNRLTKAAMAEMLGHLGGSPPTPALLNLYRQWAQGGWGMIITGNVAVERSHLGMPFDISVPPAPAPLDMDVVNSKGMAAATAQIKERGASTPMWPSSNEYARLVERFREYADACRPPKSAGGKQAGERSVAAPLAIVQLVHAGRQSMRGSGRAPWSAPLAPSPIPMRTTAALGPLGTFIDWLLWSTPREMTHADIQTAINQFAASAKLMADAGFDGVEIHASHGYLLSAFLSPRTNVRTDRYGGSAENRMRIVLEVVQAIRQRVPDDFVVGIKLNSSDYIAGGLTEEDALENVRMLALAGGVDFVEISGGNYENPSFMGHKFDSEAETRKIFGDAAAGGGSGGAAPSNSHSANEAFSSSASASGSEPQQEGASPRRKRREAFFLSFASRAREVAVRASEERLAKAGGASPSSSSSSSSSGQAGRAPMRIIVTGGLRSRSGMAECLSPPSSSSSSGGGGGGADGCGLGRASALDPHLPLRLLGLVPNDPISTGAAAAAQERQDGNEGRDEEEVAVREYTIPAAALLSKIPIQVVGAGWTTLWHTAMLHWLARASPRDGRKPATRTQPLGAGVGRALGIIVLGGWGWVVPREREDGEEGEGEGPTQDTSA